MEERLRALIAEWREQSTYSWSIEDGGAGRAWSEAADALEKELDE